MTAKAEWLTVAGDPDVWRSLGLVVSDDGLIPLMGTCIRIVDSTSIDAGMSESGSTGLVGWAFSGVDEEAAGFVDGLLTDVVDPAGPLFAAHELGASGLDHVVVMTNDLDRTSSAVEAATGCERRRVREVGSMRQGFHRIGRGGLIVEIVERGEVESATASFWGLVLNVDDLDAACDLVGEGRISEPKDAVQPGRRIATVSNDVGLGLPVALMTT
ncbi:MAG: VOC family protein [Ilumatobacter sp.]